MNIRTATSRDRGDVYRINSCAFPEEENELIAKVALDLLGEETTPPTISLVAELEGAVVGHIAFSPVSMVGNQDFRAYILAPLSVMPEYQKRRIGSTLIEHGLHKISLLDAQVVFVYGDPEYYGRFGFSPEPAQRYIPPYPLQYPFGWQALVIKERDMGNADLPISCVHSLSDPRLW